MEEIHEGSSESDSILSSNQMNGLPHKDISILPWEVLQEVFSHLDGKSLLNCKRVCKSWKDHVHYLEQKTNFWYNNCQNEIASWTQFDLLDNIFPSHWKDQSRVDWEQIYKCWCVWNSLYKAPVTVHKLSSGFKGITSIKVSGNWLFISTCEGSGKLIVQQLSEPSELIDFYVCGKPILNFELVITDRRPYSNIKPPPILKEIFQTIEHNEIWLELKDCYIQLGKNYCHNLDKIKQQVRHSYGYEVRLMSGFNCSSIILKKTCNKVQGPELMEMELSSCYTTILDFWINNISLSFVKIDKQMIVDTVSVNRRTQETSLTCSFGCNINSEFWNTYSWHGSLFVLFTSRRHIMIHQDGVETWQVTPIKKGRVTSVLFYANYFFIGTERGKLLVYKVINPGNCLKIIVYETPSWDIDVCHERIICIAIAEPVHHKRRGPAILCATPSDIYLVSLSP